jgi:hypothetical protein
MNMVKMRKRGGKDEEKRGKRGGKEEEEMSFFINRNGEINGD